MEYKSTTSSPKNQLLVENEGVNQSAAKLNTKQGLLLEEAQPSFLSNSGLPIAHFTRQTSLLGSFANDDKTKALILANFFSYVKDTSSLFNESKISDCSEVTDKIPITQKEFMSICSRLDTKKLRCRLGYL